MLVCIGSNVLLGMFSPGHITDPFSMHGLPGGYAGRSARRLCWNTRKSCSALVNAQHGNLLPVSPSFRFHLITGDADDNKFADCAIAAEADFIITSDQHFDLMRGSGYKPQPLTPEEFIRLHLGGG